MENLTPARFAEVMGIQRSGISHLLAGRNKPSFEFIQRMMTAYPDVNYEWLVLGKGRPYKTDRPVPALPENIDLFSETADAVTGENSPLPVDNQKFEPDFLARQPLENRKFDASATPDPSGAVKKIARIIVFFTDGSYEEK